MNPDNDGNFLALTAKATGADYYRTNNYSKAFANYLLALNIRQDWLDELKHAFTHSLCEWGNTLEQEKRYADLFTCYEEALKIYPHSEVILNNLGAHLLRLNHFKEACRYFRECLVVEPLYLPAHRNLENVSNLLVERWHFRMLNDGYRNDCYRRALHSLVKEGDIVLDVGTGTGLLSLFAAEKNPKIVYACDYSEVMFSFASDIVDTNGLSDRIKVINKNSHDLHIPSDLPEKVNIVVTEIMDAGLLGEGLLQSLYDVWNRLLTPTNPSKGAKCQRVIPRSANLYIAPIECSYIAQKYKYIIGNSQDVFVMCDLDVLNDLDEPYDSENLKSVEFKCLSEPREIFIFDFNDPSNIKEHLEGKRKTDVIINCDINGRLDAFAVWFDLYLNKTEVISTSPLSPTESCWEQVVFPVTRNINVEKNSKIKLSLNTLRGKLSLENYYIDMFKSTGREHFQASKDVIRFLNSKSTLKQYNIIVSKIIEKNVETMEVLDLSVYPYVGLSLLKSKRIKLVSFHNCDIDVKFLKSCVKNYDENIYSLFTIDCLLEYLSKGSQFDVVIFELFNSHGELNDFWMNLFPVIRNSMREGCVLFPSEVTVHCQLAYSEWLDNNSKLNNGSLLAEFKGYDSLNSFKTNHFIDLNINTLKYVKMSEPLIVGKMTIDDVFTDRLRAFETTSEALCNGIINSVLYWFSYGQEAVVLSSRSEDFYRNQGAEILPQALFVKKSESLSIILNYMSCILKFNVKTNT